MKLLDGSKLEGYKKISNALNLPQSTVKSIITYFHYIKWKQYGRTQTLPRSDHPSKLSTQTDGYGRSFRVKQDNLCRHQQNHQLFTDHRWESGQKEANSEKG